MATTAPINGSNSPGLVTTLTALGRMIDDGYGDVLSGLIERDYYAKKKVEWRNEQLEIEARIAQFRTAGDSYLQAGPSSIRTLEKCEPGLRIPDFARKT